MKTIALVGNPNSGKTTLFNELTGATHTVGNWPGVTVEKKQGHLRGNKHITIVDLPGIYSLSPYTLEEVITREFLTEGNPDVILNIVDASNLERNLYLTTQLLEIGKPVIVALNMIDVVKKNHDVIDVFKLSQILNCPIIELSATKGIGLKELIVTLKEEVSVPSYITFNSTIEEALSAIGYSRYNAIKLLEQDEKIVKQMHLTQEEEQKIQVVVSKLEEQLDDDAASIITANRYQVISEILKDSYRKNRKGLSLTDKIDKVVTNKWLGLPIFFAIFWLMYYLSISTIGDMFIGHVEEIGGVIQEFVNNGLVSLGAGEVMIDFVVNGIIGSIVPIFTFVPQLMIMFFFLALLEDSGYMARIAFIMDRVFSKFGLSGKSFIPMLLGTGCSVPGIMATRTIEQENDRKMTILLTPFIPCGAKLPVFAMIIVMMFNGAAWIGPTIYLIGFAGVVISGIVLKRTKRFKGDPAPFIMELPDYKLPRFKGVVIHMWDKAKHFIIKAGTVIFLACAVLWVLQNFAFPFTYVGPEAIDQSILATIGNGLRWIFVPLGFGDSWGSSVATITGLIAKEVVVATLASIGNNTDIYFSQVSAFSFMVFTIFAAPCVAAIGAMKRELGSMKETLWALGFQTGLAYVMALLVNVVGNLIFKGTQVVEKVKLDPTMLESASEEAIIQGDIVMIVFGILLGIALLYMIVEFIKKFVMKKAVVK
ncbi:ferrous iron transport protein B [Erysipelotrichaceae bacterium OH741_COT-311]|nr:ferrous iron transport protein B [Erysipelotrichaceae bacterium OH741_COT-311]